MEMKPYKSIYGENYQYDILTSDVTKKKKKVILWDDPTKDCEELVHEIIIADIADEVELYLNPEQEFGGLPRLGAKGEFSENLLSRFSTRNGKKEMCYYPSKLGDMLAWEDMKPILVEGVDDNSTEPKEKLVLLMSSRKLKLAKDRLAALKPEIRQIKRFGKQKYTLGSGK